METTFSGQATNCREGRRRAWELYRKGWKQRDIADALGVSQGAVSQWLKRGREGEVEGLRHRPPPGATPRLSLEQQGQFLELLSQGPEAFCFQGDVRTQPRVATLIRDRFGVLYDPSQVGRILKVYDWSSRKPMHRATQRNGEAIQRWKEESWPQIKKHQKKGRQWSSWTNPALSAAWQGAHLRSRGADSYQPCSSEPRPLSAMGVIIPEGRLYLMVQERAYRGVDVVGS